MASLTGISMTRLWNFVEEQTLAKCTASYTQSAEEARKLVEKLDGLGGLIYCGLGLILSRRIQHLPFPYETFNAAQVDAMYNGLRGGNGKYAKLIIGAEMIAEEPGDKGRSHMLLNGERWAANHAYPKYWKPLIVRDQTAVIVNPSGPNHPGRLVDHFTNERFNSSVVRTNYVSPVQAWKTQLNIVTKRVLQNIKYDADKMKQEGLPYQYKPITEADFREACLDEFPCSYHFPPTALHATVYFLNELTPEVFKDGCRMLDPSLGHGHRLIGALSCPNITYMAGTDPNENMHKVYSKIAGKFSKVISQIDPINYKCVKGVAEDPNNEIYKVDKLYNLVFTSPPFFNTEAYGDNTSQATLAYTTFEKWVSGFLEPMLTNCWKVLETGGYLALNLTDAHTNQCVEALMDIVVGKLKGDYLGMIPSRKAVGAARWTSKEDRTVTIKHGIDPIWVFRK